MNVSIIIPVYNEIRTIREVVQRVCTATLPSGCSREIIVVDDGSTDGTSELLYDYIARGLVRGYHMESNCGKGSAIRQGIRNAMGDVILLQDADMEYDPADYEALLTPIIRGDCDIVYGSRFKGTARGMAARNWIANKVLTGTTNLLYGTMLSDEATAYKAFRGDVLRRMRLSCERFEFCPEITAKVSRLGYTIGEVPIRYCARSIVDGKKVRAIDGLQAVWVLLKYRLSSSRNFSVRKLESH